MKKSRDTTLAVSADYRQFVTDLKSRIASARLSAARHVNRELVTLYWDIGRGIVEKQQALGWGESVVEMVAAELRAAFPDMTGFSARSVWEMKRLYEAYSTPDFLSQVVRELSNPTLRPILQQPVAELGDGAKRRQAAAKMGKGKERPQPVAKTDDTDPAPILQQLVAEIPWGHHLLILNKLTAPAARLWYLRATASFGWSRNVLLNQIKAGAYERAVTEKKTHNFGLALPEHFAEQAEEMLKSSYNLEFLGLRRAVRERELEDRLVTRLQAFLLELGYGFCFVGRQHRLVLGKKEYFIDLLFYHRFLKALVAFELKLGPFEPEFAGKMDFYLNLLNDTERAPGDQSSIGIILCAEKDDVEVEYALRTKTNPIGVAAYALQSKLPGALKGRLPTAKQLADIVRSEMEGQK
ncbi:MAG: PDDEXK nuclease domain-containing protein [Prosthecobacter sp.]